MEGKKTENRMRNEQDEMQNCIGEEESGPAAHGHCCSASAGISDSRDQTIDKHHDAPDELKLLLFRGAVLLLLRMSVLPERNLNRDGRSRTKTTNMRIMAMSYP